MNSLILASASATRARLLRAACVQFEVQLADVDEEEAKVKLLAEGRDTEGVAGALAELKAMCVSATDPQALVLGCDQILVFNGRLVGKAADLSEARVLLQHLRGKAHTLVTACVLTKGGAPVWRRLERNTMRMRPFDDEFLEEYLRAEGGSVLGCVGCYRLEGRGAQLFEAVEGDYFSVLGLPLIPLLAALRDHGIVER